MQSSVPFAVEAWGSPCVPLDAVFRHLCSQDVSGGQPVRVEAEQGGLLWGMEMDTAAAAQELRALGKDDNAERINGFLSSVGLGGFADQLKDLQLGESSALPPTVPEFCHTPDKAPGG